MNTLTLHLESPARCERIEGVVSFTAEDASGSFGILPGHARFATVVEPGLARFRAANASWRYLASPGAVLQLDDDGLHFSARRYVLDSDIGRVRAALREQLALEESTLHGIQRSLHRLEQEMMKRLWELSRGGEPA